MLKSIDDSSRTTWASHVRTLLFTYGFGFVWLSQEVGDDHIFLSQFKQRVSDCMTQSWHGQLSSSNKCKYYIEFKSLLNVERYLCIGLPFYLRRALSRFRCSSHRLSIEIGRYQGTDPVDRLCKFCQDIGMTLVEDEYHALCICTQYSDLRQRYLDCRWYVYPSTDKFQYMLSSSNPFLIKSLAVFIHHMLNRQEGKDNYC